MIDGFKMYYQVVRNYTDYYQTGKATEKDIPSGIKTNNCSVRLEKCRLSSNVIVGKYTSTLNLNYMHI